MEKKWVSQIIMELERFMDRSIQELAMSDETYRKDVRDEKALEERYESLDLTKSQKMLINDYIACMKSAASRYSELSYAAGIRDAIRIFMYCEIPNNAPSPASKK